MSKRAVFVALLLLLSSLNLGAFLGLPQAQTQSQSMSYVPFSHERVASRNYSFNASSMFFDGANYVYSTPYGTYTWLQPLNILKYVNHYGEEVVSKSVYVLQYLSFGTWLPLIDLTGIVSPVHNDTFFRLTYDVLSKKKVVGSVTLDFDCSDSGKPPKISVDFVKSALWNLGDFRWMWVVTPSASHRYQVEEYASVDAEGVPDSLAVTDYVALSSQVSKGSRNKLFIGKQAVWNGDQQWLSLDTSQFGNATWFVGSEDFWNGKGVTTIFPINVGNIDPDVAYTEMMDTITCTTADAWTDYDIHANKGVPHSAIAEIVCVNEGTTSEYYAGVRTDGSNLDRKLLLHEAESGGGVVCTFYVKVDSTTGLIEYYNDYVGLVKFFILGYFTNIDFNEAWTQLTSATTSDWEDERLAQASTVYAVTAVNAEEDNNDVGVRIDGSSLARYYNMHEAEAGGVEAFTWLVKTDAEGDIELYVDDTTNNYFYNQGYFTNLDFVEGWTQYNPANTDWQDLDISASLDVDGRYAVFLCGHGSAGLEIYVGVRENTRLFNRYILVHEAEDSTSTDNVEFVGYTSIVKSTDSGIIETYTPDTAVDYFWFIGYFKPAVAGNTAPVNDACDSTASFDYDIYGWVNQTVTDVDLVADLKTVQLTITTSDSKTFVILWTQATGAFSESSDPDSIGTIDTVNSVRVNIDTDTDKIAFKIKFNLVPQHGACNVQSIVTDDSDQTDTDTYTSEFTIAFYLSLTVNDGTHSWSSTTPPTSDKLVDGDGGSDGDIDVTVSANYAFTLQAKGNGALTSGGNTIALSNVKVHEDTLGSAASLTTSYANIGGLVNEARGSAQAKSFKLWLTVPAGTTIGSYTYTLYVQGVEGT